MNPQPFELEWMGGAAERHFRKARPATEDLPWGTLDPKGYSPVAVEAARTSWTEVAINEYRAVAYFSSVLRALVDVRAPLDLLGMTSDFLADECSHVELASRMAMELGGAAPRAVAVEGFAPGPVGKTPLERANEIILRISCVQEAFAGGTAAVSMASTTHPLPRAVYESILRDEAHHRRLGGIYFEWALARIDDAELARLGRALLTSLKSLARFWAKAPATAVRPAPSPKAAAPENELRALGWLLPARFADVAREVVVRDILDPLETIGIAITKEERAALLA
ncbi:MAG: hypothetical protein ACRENE_14535 [Polyangiaceae bacterium]